MTGFLQFIDGIVSEMEQAEFAAEHKDDTVEEAKQAIADRKAKGKDVSVLVVDEDYGK